MPKAFKSRGRRDAHKKRKHLNDEHDGGENSSKRRKAVSADEQHGFEVTGDAGDDFIQFGTDDQHEEPVMANHVPNPDDDDGDDSANMENGDGRHFYGLLDPQEQEYYANVNAKILANDFESDGDRSMFVEAVYRESKGKELKLASSQSCSRHLERIMDLSTPEQLVELFQAFLEDLEYLVQHRFGSHCCERLFLDGARFLSAKVTRGGEDGKKKKKKKTMGDLGGDETRDVSVQLEELFLTAVQKLQPNIGFLLTDKFASHVVRVLILVMSGESLDDITSKAVHAAKKQLTENQGAAVGDDSLRIERPVPASFRPALNNLVQHAIADLDTTSLRALATHPQANPVLQLLLKLDLKEAKREKSIKTESLFSKLFPDDLSSAETESAKFISSLIYDTTGSRLVEILVQYSPGKTFKKLYNHILKERMASMARNDIAGYVAAKVLERLGKDDVAEMMTSIAPHIRQLIDRRRTVIIRTFIQRCIIRGVDLAPFAEGLKAAYDGDCKALLSSILNLSPHDSDKPVSKEDPNTEIPDFTKSVDLHSSLLAQAMLQSPPTAELIHQGLQGLSTDEILALACNSFSSRVVQMSITAPTATPQFRRQFVPLFFNHVAALAQDHTGSYLVDGLWTATDGLHFMKERIANELVKHESQIRESFYGRVVWKNWQLDLYRRRPRDWAALAKAMVEADSNAVGVEEVGNGRTNAEQEGSKVGKTVVNFTRGGDATGKKEEKQDGPKPDKGKTAIQLAREKYAARKKERATLEKKAADAGPATTTTVSASA